MAVALRVALLVACLGASTARAGCEPDGIQIFPAPGAVVPINVKFLLEGRGADAARVHKLLGTQDLILKAGQDQVRVSALREWTSANKRTALLLKPVGDLLPNRNYRLDLSKLIPGVRLLNSTDSSISFRTAPVADQVPPEFKSNPVVSEGQYRKEGNQITRILKLRAPLNEEGAAYLLTTVQRAKGNPAKQIFPIPIAQEEATLGQDGCTGSFVFDDGRAYKIWVELFDWAGNTAEEKAPVIEAQAPRPD